MNFKLIFIGTLLIALAMVGVVSAGVNVVSHPGDTVFIGEQGLDITAAVGNATTLSYYTGSQTIGTSAPQKTVAVTNPANFYVSPADFSGNTGNWYLGNTNVVGLVVSEPSITISAKDASNLNTDVTGKSVTSGTIVTFRVESNTYILASQRGLTTGFATIKVRSPDGTTYTALQDQQNPSVAIPLGNFLINGNPTYWTAANTGWNTGAKDGSGNKYYKSGTYAFWVELNNLNGIKDNNNVQGHTFTAQSSVTIASDTLSLKSDKDSVTKGTNFAVTITGSPETTYNLFVKNVGAGEAAPTITANQDGVNGSGTQAYATTDSSGLRTVGFTTNQDTKDKSWTIRVELGSKSDEITVKVLKGKVSITAAGTGNYYLGDEIKLTGVNTETSSIYLFLTGPNLPSAGGQLTDARDPVDNGNATTFVEVDVNSDNTWEYKWQTANLNVDSGSYTVYAASKPVNRDHLGDAQYGTTSVTLRKPIITVSMQSMVAAGDKILIKGNAGSSPDQGVAIWIMGKNYVYYKTASVEDDGSYELELSGGDTSNLYPGQYFVVAQNPMYNDKFDVWTLDNKTYVYGTYPVDGNILSKIGGAGSLQGSDAADALENALRNPAVDDTYARTQFTIENPKITIKPISEKMVGDKFTITGITNLALDSDVLVEVVSSSFKPEAKTNASEFSGVTNTVKVKAGPTTTNNEFTMEVDTSNFKPDEYIVQASGVTTDAYGSALFTVKPYVAPTPTPTPIPPTATPTPIATATTAPVPITTVPTPTPTQSPGFGAVIACIGLIGVAFLVTRK